MAQNLNQANIDQLPAWRAMGETGDLPVGWKAPSSSSSSSSTSALPDYAAQRAIALQSVQPAVSSLEASVPEIRSKYTSAQTQVGAEKQPLKDRYAQLLDEIRGRETTQVNETTRVANREFARRGITADSTFAGEETIGRTAPIRAAAQSDITTTTLDRETKLREIDNVITNLQTDLVTSERDVRNTIAQIQATAGTDAANRALEMYKVDRQEKQNALDRALTERQVTAAETLAAKPSYTTLSEGQSLLDEEGNIIKTMPKTATPETKKGTDIATLEAIFGTGNVAGYSTNDGPRYTIIQ